MAWWTSAICAGAFVCAVIACELIRRFAKRRALVDSPNERSLHTTPTPRLGGVAIVLAVVGGTCVTLAMRWSSDLALVLGASFAISIVGLVDDVRSVPASIRFALQAALASAFVWRMGVPPLTVAQGIVIALPQAVVFVLLVIWIVGVLNIYNFMDGIDGLAGAQTITAAIAFAILFSAADAPDLALYSALLGAASSGFLMHNFPPARIFLGDAGSTFVGLSFAVLAVLGMHRGIPIAVSALALAPFLLDGTFTIVRRASRREAIWRAHRSHLYQRAVQTGLEHRDVLIVYAVWTAIALASAVLATTLVSIVMAWAANLVVLVGIWRWVVQRESQKSLAA